MKKLLLLLFIFSNAILTQAQNRTSEERIQSRIDRLEKQLDLTQDQKAQIEELFASQADRPTREELKSMSKEERQAFKEQHKAQKQEVEAGLAAILTDEQLAELEELKSERQSKRQGKKRTRGAQSSERKLDQMAETLSLTEEQKLAVEAAMKEQMAVRQSNKKHREMTEAEKAIAKENRKAAKEAFDAKMQDILTDEQYTTYQESLAAKKENARGRRSRN